MMVSQKISTTRNGIGIELFVCANSSRRVCAMSVAICTALACRERWELFWGETRGSFAKNASLSALTSKGCALATSELFSRHTRDDDLFGQQASRVSPS